VLAAEFLLDARRILPASPTLKPPLGRCHVAPLYRLYHYAFGHIVNLAGLVLNPFRQPRLLAYVVLSRMPKATYPLGDGGINRPAAGNSLLKLRLCELFTHWSKFAVKRLDRLVLYMIQFYCVLQYTNKGDAI